MVVVAVAFAGWYSTSLETLKIELSASLKSQELHLMERVNDARASYNQDVERFIRAVGENRTVLGLLVKDINGVKVRLGRAEAKQDLILEKIKLTE
jgi:hypothetical protein